jgi:hypothetical protein
VYIHPLYCSRSYHTYTMSQTAQLGKINQAYAVLATTNGRDKVSLTIANGQALVG